MGGEEGTGLLVLGGAVTPGEAPRRRGGGSQWEVPAGEDAVGLEMVTLALRVGGMAWGSPGQSP